MPSWRHLVTAVLAVAVAGGCSSASMQPPVASSRPPVASSRPMSLVPLAPAPSVLRTQCAAAAARLSFAVPCPTLVPTIGGRPASCPAPQGVMPARCVGYEGLGFHPIFFMQLSEFDVPADYVGVDGKREGHLIIEARRHGFSPSLPCIGGNRLADVRLTQLIAEQFSCPPDSAVVEREAMNGEGAFAGHLILLWDLAGVDYLVSVHGNTVVNLQLLKRLADSVRLVEPSGSSEPLAQRNGG